MRVHIENFNKSDPDRPEPIENGSDYYGQGLSAHMFDPEDMREDHDGRERYGRVGFAPPGYGRDDYEDEDPEPDDDPAPRRSERTEKLIRNGRGPHRPGRSRSRTIVIAVAAAGAAIAVIVGLLTVLGGSASWPASVATVQAEITKACQNPDVVSEPGQVNFACAKETQQVLWVFALLTSGGNPNFADQRSARIGLEPIAPTQGGQLAWSLNLHQPYNPVNPVDSLEVAARAINNIVGGATVTGTRGNTVVEPGLESSPQNCARYTGSPAVIARAGYPSICELPVTTTAGQAALVSNIYQQWVVGASPVTAQDAGVLFANANNPGDPQVQAILHSMPPSGL